MLATDRKLPLSGGQEKRSYVRAMFTAIAPRYDFLNHLLSLNIDRRWRRQAPETRLLHSTLQPSGGLTHVLTLNRTPPDTALPPTQDAAANVGQLMGTSEFIEGRFRLYPIQKIGSCVEAWVRHE